MSRESIRVYLVPVFLSLVVLSPMLHTGYISDDSFYSMARGRLLENNQSLLSAYCSAVKRTIIHQSRFSTLGFLPNFLTFIVFSNLHLYKLYLLLLIITNIILFQYLIALLTKSKFLSFLSTLFLPLFFQFLLSPVQGFENVRHCSSFVLPSRVR